MSKKTNWYWIKKEFLRERNTTLKDVAIKYGISYGYLRKISMYKGWGAEKKWFWKEVDKALEKELQRIFMEKTKRDTKRNIEQMYLDEGG